METQTAAADAVSTTTDTAAKPAAAKRRQAPHHSALTVLGRAFRVRDQYQGVDDRRVKEDLQQLATAIEAVETVSRSIPGLKAEAGAAKAQQAERLRAVKGRILMVSTALKLRPEGEAIVEASRDPLPAIFAEVLCNRIPADFLGDDQPLVRELEKESKRLHQATEALAEKEAAVTGAVGRYEVAVRELNLAISQLLASVRGYQARLKLSAA